jgi:hypothetical protein
VVKKSSLTTALIQTNTTTKPTAKKHQSHARHQVNTDPKMDKNAKNALLEIIATVLQNLLVILVITALVMVHNKPAHRGPLVTVKEKKTKKPVNNVLLGRTIKFQDERLVIAVAHQERLTLNTKVQKIKQKLVEYVHLDRFVKSAHASIAPKVLTTMKQKNHPATTARNVAKTPTTINQELLKKRSVFRVVKIRLPEIVSVPRQMQQSTLRNVKCCHFRVLLMLQKDKMPKVTAKIAHPAHTVTVVVKVVFFARRGFTKI